MPLNGRIQALNRWEHFQIDRNGKIRLAWLKIAAGRSSANSALANFVAKFLQKIKEKDFFIYLLKYIHILSSNFGEA